MKILNVGEIQEGTHPESSIEECPMCGGTGGWQGVNGWVTCQPCHGKGRTEEAGEPPVQ